MSPFTVFGLLVCFQACMVKNVLGQCLPSGHALGYGTSINECSSRSGNGFGFLNGQGNVYGSNAVETVRSYGGAGTGDLDVAGQLPVTGITTIVGQVPILGAVQFGGDVPAAGTVSIFGKCGCDCNGGPQF